MGCNGSKGLTVDHHTACCYIRQHQLLLPRYAELCVHSSGSWGMHQAPKGSSARMTPITLKLSHITSPAHAPFTLSAFHLPHVLALHQVDPLDGEIGPREHLAPPAMSPT